MKNIFNNHPNSVAETYLQHLFKPFNFGYQYLDECFGVNLDWGRDYFEDRDLQHTGRVTILFSFKDLGGYQSKNLAVSENEKQNIRWNTR